jgi:hypothetical protein
MGNIMSCKWHIWNDVVSLHDISDITFIIFHQVGGQRQRHFLHYLFLFFLLRLGVPQAILLIMATTSCGFKVSCSQIPRCAFAGIRTHDPLVESPTS